VKYFFGKILDFLFIIKNNNFIVRFAVSYMKYFNCVLFILFFISSIYASEFIKDMESGTIEEKIEAMHQLGYSKNKKSFWYLVKYLSFKPHETDSERTIQARMAAAEALGRLQDERAVDYLIEAWKTEENEMVKEKIMFAFRYYKNESIKEIIKEGLQDQNLSIVFQTLLSAAHYRDESLTENITAVFNETEDEIVKTAAAYSIMKIKDDDTAQNYLRDSLKSDKPWRRYWASYFIADARLVTLLSDILKSLEIENVVWVEREMERTVVVLRNERKIQSRLRRNRELNSMVQQDRQTESQNAEEADPAND
jgi:hypothetical protein